MQNKDTGRGVLYLGHIPRGFYEPQMWAFFSQFGRVSRIKMCRSKKTGNSKGYAFIEFQFHDIAKIVAETMNNYLMFMRLLKCELLPQEKIHPDLFKGSDRKFSAPKAEKVAALRHNSQKSPKTERRTRSKLNKKLQKLKDLGFDFNPEAEQTPSGQAKEKVPKTVSTPAGKLQVLKEDASDMEVTFKTPPGAIKSSRLAVTPVIKQKKKKGVKRLK